MSKQYHYEGQELYLFEQAKKWKKYVAGKIEPFISGDVLEVGAGIAETTPHIYNDRVTRWICLEPDPILLQEIQNKMNSKKLPALCEARPGRLSDLSPDEKFDTIIYIDVLEHIEKDREELELALNFLKEGGRLIVLCPAFQFLYSPFDKAIGHYRRYTKKTLRQAAHISRLQEKKIFYLEFTGMLLLLINKVLVRKKYPGKKDIWIWENIFVPASRVMDRILFYSLGKSIIGIWQKF